MECSSQAMDFHRCDELEYAVAVFSNLTRDHLDYHKTMENYWYAKQRLFDGASDRDRATRSSMSTILTVLSWRNR
jgi:UDP-N-acetylmuramoyl-L-alanyl-D-glutamate--2,6-diaminopimelate ligase